MMGISVGNEGKHCLLDGQESALKSNCQHSHFRLVPGLWMWEVSLMPIT